MGTVTTMGHLTQATRGSIDWAGQNLISAHCRERLRASENFTLDMRNLWDSWLAVFSPQTFRLYLLPLGSSCLSRSVHTRLPKAKVMNKYLTSSSPDIWCLANLTEYIFKWAICITNSNVTILDRRVCGGVVVKELRYKPAGRGFDSRCCNWNFSVT